MAKTPPKSHARSKRKLQLGPWLRRLGRKQVELARAIDKSEAYVSNLVAGSKEGPTPDVLLDISEFLEISVNELYSTPPSTEAVETVKEMSPAEAASLAKALEILNAKKPKR